MSRSYSEILLETMLERRRLLENWRRLVAKAARVVKQLYPEAQIYLTGSVVRGDYIAASDVDLVIVLDHEPTMREAAEVIARVWEALDLPPSHPLELHVVGPKGLEKYRRRGPLHRVA